MRLQLEFKGVHDMKVILVIGDGISDRPTRFLNGKTPLQVAEKPSINLIARQGICGVMDPIAPGIPPGSDTAHLALLGYDPVHTYTGRGAFEALGVGLEVRQNDVSFRCNFATVNEDLLILDRRAGRIKGTGDKLAQAINGIKLEHFPEINVIVKHSVEHRSALILRGPNLSRMVSDSDPSDTNYPIQKVRALDNSSEASRTACIVNAVSKRFHEILTNHPINMERRANGLLPANAVLFRGAGTLPQVKPITEIYGIKALIVAAGAMYRGVCKSVGLDVIDVPGATGTFETDTVAKAKAAVENLPRYDYILIHIKGADNASHDGNTEQKVRMIEKIDALVKHLLDNVDLESVFIALTADHTTSLDLRKHVGDPVPLAIMGPGVRVDSVEKYSEIDCAQGGLGRIKGIDLTPILMDLAGNSKTFGA